MVRSNILKQPLSFLTAFLFLASNLTFLKVESLSFSFFIGLLTIVSAFFVKSIFSAFKRDMQVLLLFIVFGLISLLFSPIIFNANSLYTVLQIVYWFLLANIFANLSRFFDLRLFARITIGILLFFCVAFSLKGGIGVFLSENETSFIVVSLWPLGLLVFKTLRRAIYILFVVFTLLAIGSRTGIIVVLLQLLTFYLVIKVESKIVIRIVAVSLIIYIVMSLPQVRRTIAEVVFPQDVEMQMLIETPELAFQMDKSWVQRRIQQEKCKQTFAEYPLLGIGPLNISKYNFSINVSEMSDVDSDVLKAEYLRSDERSAHNAYYQLLAENGLIGFLLSLAILIKPVITMYKKREESETYLVLLASAIGLIINLFMVSGFWGTNTWLLLGLYTGYVRNIKRPLLLKTSGYA